MRRACAVRARCKIWFGCGGSHPRMLDFGRCIQVAARVKRRHHPVVARARVAADARGLLCSPELDAASSDGTASLLTPTSKRALPPPSENRTRGRGDPGELLAEPGCERRAPSCVVGSPCVDWPLPSSPVTGRCSTSSVRMVHRRR